MILYIFLSKMHFLFRLQLRLLNVNILIQSYFHVKSEATIDAAREVPRLVRKCVNH